MNSLLIALSLVASGGFGNQPIEPTTLLIDLPLGISDPPPHVLVPLPAINAAVTFQRGPHTSMCPSSRPADFDLEKINPLPRQLGVVEHISMICTRFDSVSIDTSIVYIVHNAFGGKYYMRMLEQVGEKVRVRLTSELPVTIRDPEPLPAPKPGASEGPAYRLGGRSLEKQGSGDPDAGMKQKAYRRPARP
jgi:hypothetical protein